MVVSMSLSHVKSMIGALFNAISGYEKDVGKIPLPKDAQVAYDKAVEQFKKSA